MFLYLTTVFQTWQDLKRNTKHKASQVKKHMQCTGGGEPAEDFTPQEHEILDIITNTSTHGHEEVEESSVNFQFEVNLYI